MFHRRLDPAPEIQAPLPLPARKKEIKSGWFESVGRRVGAYEFDRGDRRQPFGSPRQHRRRNVNAQHVSGRANALGERDRACTGTAADIDNTLALPQLRSLQRCLQDRTKDDVL
jgi:hypothetical protein